MRKGQKQTAESNQKNRLKQLGKKMSVEAIEKMSKAKKGIILKEEHKRKISDSHKKLNKKGEKHHSWKGGVSLMPGYRKMITTIWLEKNMARKLWLNSQRRERIAKAEGKHSYEEWEELKKEFNYTCPSCEKKEPEIKLTVDHIIPISKGGRNDIENLQPLCRPCNSRKNIQTTSYKLTSNRPF